MIMATTPVKSMATLESDQHYIRVTIRFQAKELNVKQWGESPII